MPLFLCSLCAHTLLQVLKKCEVHACGALISLPQLFPEMVAMLAVYYCTHAGYVRSSQATGSACEPFYCIPKGKKISGGQRGVSFSPLIKPWYLRRRLKCPNILFKSRPCVLGTFDKSCTYCVSVHRTTDGKLFSTVTEVHFSVEKSDCHNDWPHLWFHSVFPPSLLDRLDTAFSWTCDVSTPCSLRLPGSASQFSAEYRQSN